MDNGWRWQKQGTAWKGIGIYHVTIVVPSREPLLGTLIIPDNDPQKAYVEHSEIGTRLIKMLLENQNYYPEVRVLQFCIMPDHLHVILHVMRPMDKTFNTVVRSLWQGAKKIGRASFSSISPESHSASFSSISPESHSASFSSISPESHSASFSSISPESHFASFSSISPESHSASFSSISPESHSGSLFSRFSCVFQKKAVPLHPQRF